MKPRSLEVLVLLALTAGVSYLLFLPPVVGLADQFDFWRLMDSFGLKYPASLPPASRYWCFLQTTYTVQAPESGPFLSTESLFLAVAMLLNGLFGKTPHSFDIRMLGFVHMVFFLGAIWLLLGRTRNLQPLSRVVFAILVVLVGCDVGYVAYFNSLYLEAATYISGILLIAAMIMLAESPKLSPPLLISATSAMVLFAGAKSQNMPLLAIGVIFLALGVGRTAPRSRRWSLAWVVSALLVCAFLVSTYFSVAMSPRVRQLNLYNSVFLQVLPYSPTPGADMVALGLDPKLVRYSGQAAFNIGPGFDPEAAAPASYTRLLMFYLTRPGRFLGLTGRGLAAALVNRDPMLGNFERSTGLPCQTMAQSLKLWDTVRKRLTKPWFLIPFLILNLAVPFALAWREWRPQKRLLLQVQVTVVLMAVAAFYVAILGDGNEFQKHLFPFNFLVDCLIIANILWLTEKVSSLLTQAGAIQFKAVRKPVLLGASVCFVAGTAAAVVLWKHPARPAIAPGESVIGYLDQVDGKSEISASRGAKIEVSGWAACVAAASPLSKVEILVDNQVQSIVIASYSRRDVAEVFARADFEKSGWKTSFSGEGIAPGIHQISARGTCLNGQSGTLPAFLLVVRDQ